MAPCETLSGVTTVVDNLIPAIEIHTGVGTRFVFMVINDGGGDIIAT